MIFPQVGIIMGSRSDLSVMQPAAEVLTSLQVSHELMIISAHRTPDRVLAYARSARERGIKVIIAGAGGAAHLPGMIAAMTELPVFGVPVASPFMQGLDSLLSVVQMPFGVPVGTLAAGKGGSGNAALLAAAVLALSDDALAERLRADRAARSSSVAAEIQL